MYLDHQNGLFQHLRAFWSKIHTWVHLNLLHTNKFCQHQLVPLLCVCCFWSRTTNYENSIRMIWNKWSFFIAFYVVFICNTVQINHFVMYNNDSFLLDVVEYLKELPFYNKYIEKPKTKRRKNIDLLSEIPFHKELNVIKGNHAFRG